MKVFALVLVLYGNVNDTGLRFNSEIECLKAKAQVENALGWHYRNNKYLCIEQTP